MTDREFLIKYLWRYQRALAKIAELNQLRQRIEEKSVSIKSADLSAVKVQTNKLSDKVSSYTVSVVSIDERIQRIEQRLENLAQEISDAIKLPCLECEEWSVLYLHFLSGRKLSELGTAIGVSRSQVYVLYNRSLDILLNNSEVRERLTNYKQRLIDNHLKRKQSLCQNDVQIQQTVTDK